MSDNPSVPASSSSSPVGALSTSTSFRDEEREMASSEGGIEAADESGNCRRSGEGARIFPDRLEVTEGCRIEGRSSFSTDAEVEVMSDDESDMIEIAGAVARR